METKRVYYANQYGNPKVEVTTLDKGQVISVANRKPDGIHAITEAEYQAMVNARTRLIAETEAAIEREGKAKHEKRKRSREKLAKKLGLDMDELEALFP